MNDSKYGRLYPERAVAPVRMALQECQRLAVDRLRTADAAVKKDVYAADALMGIAKITLDALADLDTLGFPPDEPLFLVRGQDEIGPEVVRFYIGRAADRLAPIAKQHDHLMDFADRMAAWQPRKLPD